MRVSRSCQPLSAEVIPTVVNSVAISHNAAMSEPLRQDEPTDSDALNQEVGSNVHALMAKRGVKGTEIAKLLGLEPQSLSARLHGKTPFKAHELAAIADRLQVEPGILFSKVPRILVVSNAQDVVYEPTLPGFDSFARTLELVKVGE